jgi:hypothetical protein
MPFLFKARQCLLKVFPLRQHIARKSVGDTSLAPGVARMHPVISAKTHNLFCVGAAVACIASRMGLEATVLIIPLLKQLQQMGMLK